MSERWTHPKFGRFTYRGLEWKGTIALPAFRRFSYDTGYPDPLRAKGKCQLRFTAEDEHEVPGKAQVALLAKAVQNEKLLAGKVMNAVWDDFNGRGPGGEMWWHGDLQAVNENLTDERCKVQIKQAKDVLKVMTLSCVSVEKKLFDLYKKPIIELSFHAAFEPEHGVGVLTNGRSVLGLAYTSDVLPFKKRGKR